MSLPFTREQFFQVFGTYNDAVTPLQIGFVLLGLSAYGAMVLRRRDSDRVISAILAALWAWMGIVYHLIYFREVNPAATLFGIAFLAGAALFAWAGVLRGKLAFDGEGRARRIAGHVLVAYALVGYPLLSAMLGREFPQLPTFGLPWPDDHLYPRDAGVSLAAVSPLRVRDPARLVIHRRAGRAPARGL